MPQQITAEQMIVLLNKLNHYTHIYISTTSIQSSDTKLVAVR